ncbi:MAG: hypothetical protein ACTSWN_08215 [Promethearchaeota archaeon]
MEWHRDVGFTGRETRLIIMPVGFISCFEPQVKILPTLSHYQGIRTCIAGVVS